MDYSYWQRTLAGERVGMHEDDPQCGFYRYKTNKGGEWVPLAIFDLQGARCLLAGVVGATQYVTGDVWVSAARHPITEARYRKWCDTGTDEEQNESRLGIGGNNPPEDMRLIALELASEARAVKVEDETTGERAALLKRQVTDAEKKLNDERRTLKKPFEDQAKAVDADFKESLDALASAKAHLTQTLTQFLKQKKVEESETKVGGNTYLNGKKRSVSLRKVEVEVLTDRMTALKHFAAMSDCGSWFDDAILSAAKASRKAKIQIPGVEYKIEERAV